MHTYKHISGPHIAENRLCYLQRPDSAFDAETRSKEMKDNPALKDAVRHYIDHAVRSGREEFTKDRRNVEMFSAFLVEGMSNDPVMSYKKTANTDFDAADPLDFRTRYMGKPYYSSVDDLGKYLKELRPDRFPTTKSDAVTGQEYLDKIGSDTVPGSSTYRWNTNRDSPDELIIEVTITEYLRSRALLNTLLEKAQINPDPSEREDMTSIGLSLTTNEYMALLTLIWKRQQPKVEEILGKATGNRLERVHAVRTALITDGAARKVYEKALTAYTDTTVERVGGNERLNRFGVEIGHSLVTDYKDFREGKLVNAPYMPNDSAATWIDYPERAYEFLHTRIPFTPANTVFLHALRWHFVLTEDQRKIEEAASVDNVPKMDEKDTKVLMQAVIKTLLEREQIVDYSKQDRTKKGAADGFDTLIEKHGGYMIDYIKDVGSHPIGSIMLGGIAVGMIYGTWKLLTNGPKWLKYGFYIVGGGIAVALYQKHQYGKITTGSNTADKWLGEKGKWAWSFFQSEKDRPVEEQTLQRYWSEHLTEDPEYDGGDSIEDRSNVLSMLQDQPIDKTLAWYESMERWLKSGGGKDADMPTLPFNLPNRSKFFGQRSTKEISRMFYATLHRFFYERGNALPDDKTMPGNTKAERGLAYIRFKYLRDIDRLLPQEAKNLLKKLPWKGKEYDLDQQADLDALRKADGMDPKTFDRIVLGWKFGKTLYSPFPDRVNPGTQPMAMMLLAEAHDLAALRKLDPSAADFVGDMLKEINSSLPPGSPMASTTYSPVPSANNKPSASTSVAPSSAMSVKPGSSLKTPANAPMTISPKQPMVIMPMGNITITPITSAAGAPFSMPGSSMPADPFKPFTLLPSNTYQLLAPAETKILTPDFLSVQAAMPTEMKPGALFAVGTAKESFVRMGDAAALTSAVPIELTAVGIVKIHSATASEEVQPGKKFTLNANETYVIEKGAVFSLKPGTMTALEAAEILSLTPRNPTAFRADALYVLQPGENFVKPVETLTFTPAKKLAISAVEETMVVVNGVSHDLAAGDTQEVAANEKVILEQGKAVSLQPAEQMLVRPNK